MRGGHYEKNGLFSINSLMLTSAVLLSRVIGISFRVYMSNKIGAEGIGLYQLICTIFLFASTFCHLRRQPSGDQAGHRSSRAKGVSKSENRCAQGSGSGAFLQPFDGGPHCFSSADYIGNQVLKDPRTILSLKILAPSLPFMAVSACFRGYFFAVRQVIKTASEQLLEQIAEIVIFALASELSGAHGPGICLLRHCAGNDRCGEFFPACIHFFALLGRAAEAQGQGF